MVGEGQTIDYDADIEHLLPKLIKRGFENFRERRKRNGLLKTLASVDQGETHRHQTTNLAAGEKPYYLVDQSERVVSLHGTDEDILALLGQCQRQPIIQVGNHSEDIEAARVANLRNMALPERSVHLARTGLQIITSGESILNSLAMQGDQQNQTMRQEVVGVTEATGGGYAIFLMTNRGKMIDYGLVATCLEQGLFVEKHVHTNEQESQGKRYSTTSTTSYVARDRRPDPKLELNYGSCQFMLVEKGKLADFFSHLVLPAKSVGKHQ